MWQIVGGVLKWVGIGVGTAEGLDLLADATLSEDSSIRGALDGASGSLFAKGFVAAIAGLDKMMGGHFLGKFFGDMLNDMMPGFLPPDDMAKLRGTTPNEEWSANYMHGFAQFNEWNDSAKVAAMGKLAHEQGFTGLELGENDGSNLAALRVAQFASKDMQTTSSEQFHFLLQKFKDSHQGSMEVFMQDMKTRGMGSDTKEITRNLGYRTPSEIAAGDVAPQSQNVVAQRSAPAAAPPVAPVTAAEAAVKSQEASVSHEAAPAAASSAATSQFVYPPVPGAQTEANATIKGPEAPNGAPTPVQEAIPVDATLAHKGKDKHHVHGGIDQVKRTDEYNTPARRGNHNVLKVTSIEAVDLKTGQQAGYKLNVGNTTVSETGIFAQDKGKKPDAPAAAATDKKPVQTAQFAAPKPMAP